MHTYIHVYIHTYTHKYTNTRKVIGYGLDDRGLIPDMSKVPSFSTTSRPSLELIHPPIQWALVTISPKVKQPEREADQSPSSGAVVLKYMELYLYSTTQK
jgi:hypothetical protein